MTNPIGNGPRVDRTGVGTASGSTPADPRDNATGTDNAHGGVAAKASSMQSERLQAIRSAIEGTPAVDRDRVAAIRDQIARGEYPLNPDRIAQRFAEFEKLLHG